MNLLDVLCYVLAVYGIVTLVWWVEALGGCSDLVAAWFVASFWPVLLVRTVIRVLRRIW